jgi:hypothetical protein
MSKAKPIHESVDKRALKKREISKYNKFKKVKVIKGIGKVINQLNEKLKMKEIKTFFVFQSDFI